MLFKLDQVVGHLPVKVSYVNYECKEYHISFGSSVVESITLPEDELLVLEAEINKEAAKARIKAQIESLQASLLRLEGD